MIDNNCQVFDNIINKICFNSNFNYIKNNDICSLCNNSNKLFIKSECSYKEHKICITCVANMKTFDSCNICNTIINNIYPITECIKCNIIDKTIKYSHECNFIDNKIKYTNGKYNICVNCCKINNKCQFCKRISKSACYNIISESDYSIYNIYNIDYAIYHKNHLFDKIFNNYNDHILLSISISISKISYNLEEYINFLKLIYSFYNFIKKNGTNNLNLENVINNLIKKSEYLTYIFSKFKIEQTKKRFILLMYESIGKYIMQLEKYLEITYSDNTLIYKIKI